LLIKAHKIFYANTNAWPETNETNSDGYEINLKVIGLGQISEGDYALLGRGFSGNVIGVENANFEILATITHTSLGSQVSVRQGFQYR
jgi:hypothetical protein